MIFHGNSRLLPSSLVSVFGRLREEALRVWIESNQAAQYFFPFFQFLNETSVSVPLR